MQTKNNNFWNLVWGRAYPGIREHLEKYPGATDFDYEGLDWGAVSKLNHCVIWGRMYLSYDDRAYVYKNIRPKLKEHFKHVWIDFVETLEPGNKTEHWWVADCSNGDRLELSVTLPVKDEAETLEKTILSFLPIADELIISIDSKSSDASRAIAERYADKVITHVWEKHFSKVRNYCIDNCTKDWIFMTEGHVYLDPESVRIVRLMMRDGLKGFDGISARMESFNKRWFFPYMIRRDESIRYHGASHNNVHLNKEKTANAHIYLVHDRSAHKDKERSEQRKKMNPYNFYKDLIKNPHDTRALFYLGSDYCERGEHEKGIAMWARRLGYKHFTQERYQTRIYLFRAYRYLGKKEEAAKILHGCVEDDSTRNEHWLALAELAEEQGNLELAKLWLRLATQYKEPLSPMFVDHRMYAEEPWRRLCSLYAQTGEFEKALVACDELLNSVPGDKEVLGIRKQIKDKLK